MNKLCATLIFAGGATVVALSQAQAGGFNRGTANLDGLYGATQLGMYAGVTYVSPQRSYDTISGTDVSIGLIGVDPGPPPSPVIGPIFGTFEQTGVEFANSYTVPYASVGGRIVGDVSCVGSYSQPFGADSEYSGAVRFHVASQSLETNELGLTCAYGFDLSKGRLSVIGGAFYETVDYKQSQDFTGHNFGVTGESRVELTSNALGYRIGLGYEIPEYALKAQLVYRSQTNHDATGDYSNTPFAMLSRLTGRGNPSEYGLNTSASAYASASLPGMVDLSVQSGIAEDWLAFGSIRWTDWSVLEDIQIVEGIQGQPFSTSSFFFEDGWTITGGLGHRFKPDLSGMLSLTWDKGVSTGWDTLTDTWSLAGGLSYDVSSNFQLRAGGAAIYFTDGEKSQFSNPTLYYTATSSSEWGYALSLSGSAKF